MEFSELAAERFSVLEYEHRSAAQEAIDQILAAGMAAPTACNFQPQRILVIDDDLKRQQLARVVPSRYFTPLAFLDWAPYGSCFGTRSG